MLWLVVSAAELSIIVYEPLVVPSLTPEVAASSVVHEIVTPVPVILEFDNALITGGERSVVLKLYSALSSELPEKSVLLTT